MSEQTLISRKKFLIYHLLLPIAAFGLVILALEYTGLDVWLATHFYDQQLHLWPLREHWLSQQVIHKGGRYFVYVLGIAVLLSWLWSFRTRSALNKYNLGLAYLLAASLTGPIIVTILKSRTHIYCPWDLTIFGGNKPHIRLFDSLTSDLTVGHCFPSGHSVLGFTFVSLYYFCLIVNPRYKYLGLWVGLVWGMIFGLDQQMRGAHFLSHDISSLAICWLSASLVFGLFFRKQFK